VAQLSLYLKLLEDETIGSTAEFQNEFHFTLLPSLADNIVCGNSLIGTDIEGQFTPEEERKLNAMDFERRFPQIFRRKTSGGELREAAPGDIEHNVPGGMPLHGNYTKVSYRKKAKEKAIGPSEMEYAGGFDAIVGNPPYVRPHNLGKTEKSIIGDVTKLSRTSPTFIVVSWKKPRGFSGLVDFSATSSRMAG